MRNLLISLVNPGVCCLVLTGCFQTLVGYYPVEYQTASPNRETSPMMAPMRSSMSVVLTVSWHSFSDQTSFFFTNLTESSFFYTYSINCTSDFLPCFVPFWTGDPTADT